MKISLPILIALLLISVTVYSADVIPEVKKNTPDGLGSGSSSGSEATISSAKVSSNEKLSVSGSNVETNLEIKQADSLEKAKVSNEIKTNTVDKTKSAPSKLLGGKENGDVETGSKDKELKDAETESKGDEGLGSKSAVKEEKSSLMKKGSFRDEQCDSAFKCTIGNGENDGMVACLSVPGDESTEVSLLIQNKGKGLLDVGISAPNFVRLDKTKIQIPENDNQKVMVSIGEGKPETFITLKTISGSCNLDFMNFFTHNSLKKSNYISELRYTSLFRRTPFLGLISLAFLLVILSVVVCVTYQKRRLINNGTKYQKLDAEIPVSGGLGPKIDYDQKDGWNDNWSDDWGDVEAPNTPSMPHTPSISSAGVSSRRVNKDAWKD